MGKFAQKKDLLVLGGLLFVALLAWLFHTLLSPPGDSAAARILFQGEEVLELSLDREGQFSIPQRPQVVLEVRDGRCAFVASDCPDKVCIHAGYLGRVGQSAACLPNGMVLQIVATGEPGADDLDAVLR